MGDTRIVGGLANTPQIINRDGHALVEGEVLSKIGAVSWKGDAHRILAEVDLIVGAPTLEPLLWLQSGEDRTANNHDVRLVIARMVASADGACHVEMFLDETYTSGGATAMVVNLNRTSARIAKVTAFDGSAPLVLGGTALEIESFFLAANAVHEQNFGDALILGQNDRLSIQAEGAIGVRVRVALDFYFTSDPDAS